jgi:hypothetical protein
MIGAAPYLDFDSRELEVGYFLLVDLEELQLFHQLSAQSRSARLGSVTFCLQIMWMAVLRIPGSEFVHPGSRIQGQ